MGELITSLMDPYAGAAGMRAGRKLEKFGRKALPVYINQMLTLDYATEEGKSNGDVWALDRATGATLWRQKKLGYRGVTAPVPFGEHYVVVGDREGYLFWLDRSDGHFVARVRVDGSGVLVPPVADGDTLYVLSRDGKLAAYRIGEPAR
jgi:outer membrane protein assembly factor BamB